MLKCRFMHCTGKVATEVHIHTKKKGNQAKPQWRLCAKGRGRPFNMARCKKKGKRNHHLFHYKLIPASYQPLGRKKPRGSRLHTRRTRKGTKPDLITHCTSKILCYVTSRALPLIKLLSKKNTNKSAKSKTPNKHILIKQL